MTRQTPFAPPRVPDGDPLSEQLRSLGLYVMAERYKEIADKAQKAKSPYSHFLAELVTAQLAARMDRSFRERIARARFPAVKTIEEFDFNFQPGLDETLMRTLADTDFLNEKKNVLFVGPPGVGKTHLAIALGVRACANRRRAAFYTVSELMDSLVASQLIGQLPAKLLELSKIELLILDELGYLNMDATRANIFFQLVSRMYEKGSIIITTNRRFEAWADIFAGDAVIAGAILDRLLHHRHLVPITGNSYRTHDLLAEKATESTI